MDSATRYTVTSADTVRVGSIAPDRSTRPDLADRLPHQREPLQEVDTAAGPEPGPAAGARNWSWRLAAGFFALYAAISVREHHLLATHGYDLGIFEQAVRSYAHGQLPVGELKGHQFPLLGDHFSPILMVLAPLYRAFPSPLTLLVAQAALFALTLVPVVSTAARIMGRRAGILIGLALGLSWGIAQAVEFDFHEIAFALPLLAFSACALIEGRATAAVSWALPLLLVKEDQGLTVAVLGLLVWRVCGRRTLGLATAAAGVAGTGIAFVVLKAMNPAGAYSQAHTMTSDHDLLYRATIGLVTPESKAQLVVLLLAPTAFVALRSPVSLLIVPTLGWRLASDWWPYTTGHYHYNATAMPILFVAMIDGLRRMTAAGAHRQARQALLASAIVTVVLVPSNVFASVIQPATWHPTQRVTDAEAVLAKLPDGANVATSNIIAPHLTGRDTVSIYGWTDAESNPDWLLIDRASWPWPFGSWDKQEAALAASRAAGFRDVYSQGDFVLLHRGGR